MVYEVAKVVDIPIIGMGGIFSGEDAVEFIMAGSQCRDGGNRQFYQSVGVSADYW